MSEETIEQDGQTLKKKKKKKPAKPSKEPKKSKAKNSGAASEGDGAQSAEDPAKGMGRLALSDSQKSKLRKEIQDVLAQAEGAYFDLADALYRVVDAAAYLDWSGPILTKGDDDSEPVTENRKYANFHEYAVNEVGLEKRKADYFVSISRFFSIDMRDHPEVKEKVKPLGWSKVKELVKIVNEENVDEWVARAKKMTVAQLAAACAEHLNPTGDDARKDDPRVKRITFTLVDDQPQMVEQALKHAGEVAQSDKTGYQLTMICTDYLASSTKAGLGKSQQAAYLRRMESILGLKLIAVDPEAKEVVYGKQTFASLGTKE